jgi:hypothetical protein
MRVPVGEFLEGWTKFMAASRTILRFRESKSAPPPQARAGSTADDSRSYAVSRTPSTCSMSNGDSILSIAGRSTEST